MYRALALISASRQHCGHVADARGDVRLCTRMQVREDAMTLFGFSSKDERTMFDRLVSVSGVGRAWRSPCFPLIPWGSCIRW